MTMRITGLASGLDTESIITELTKVQSNKVDKIKSDQKKHDMKMDKWKELNKKVVDFYNKTLSSLRFDSSYIKKTTSVSNENAVTISTSGTAMNSSQKLSVDKLASSAYLTGGKISSKTGELKATTSITNLSGYSGTAGVHKEAELDEEGNEIKPAVTDDDYRGIIRVKFGKAPAEGEEDTREYVDVKIDPDKSITEALAELKQAKSASGYGINASLDAGQGRVYVTSTAEGEDESFSIDFDHSDMRVVSALGLDYDTNEDAIHTEGGDAQITLNGAVYTSNSNTFDVNGLTITAKQVASDITLQTKDDTSGIYDMVKNFLKEYNDLIGEMYTLYNADDAKDYAILTKEQKDEMTDDEIEDWNKKIDEGLLAKDPTIFRAMTEMKNIMMQSFDWGELDYNKEKDEWVEVKTSFWSFHIATPGYFEGEEADRMKWHIYGDEDDDFSSSKEDKLKAKIEKDPELVRKFFKTISSDMYSKLGDLMKSTDFSSAYTLYEDKQMKKQVDTYKTQLKDAQDKLGKMEDKYYDKFAQMEKAMTKLNEQTSSLSGMLGTG
ncbi:flagellar filament capping protein FliD [Butyrivibrio sp. AE3006]|uniref:flagellar filament capping protein FliD n=1 Tax=Butyrivibrio sp. AE3006 TaxID=1280673 RepID=UPI000411F7FF|nr:flagellar filament capping protein FliD [Butyrivibrio sp. AE3006]